MTDLEQLAQYLDQEAQRHSTSIAQNDPAVKEHVGLLRRWARATEQAGRRTTPDREAIIEECRQAALQRSAMLPNDNDFWRGYANGRVDAAGDIARLKTAPNGEKK